MGDDVKRRYVYIISILFVIVSVFIANYENLNVSYSKSSDGCNCNKDGNCVCLYDIDPPNVTSAIGELNDSYCAVSASYLMHFYTNGHGNVENASAMISELPNMPTLSATGFVFNGWYADQALTKKVKDYNDLILYTTKDSYGCGHLGTNVYAKWTPVSTNNTMCSNTIYYDLYYDTNGGGYIPVKTYSGRVTSIDLPTPTKSGYVFAGWYTNASLSVKVTTDINSVPFNTITDQNGCGRKVATIFAKWVVQSTSKPPSESQKPKQKPKDNDNSHLICSNEINKLHISFNSNEGSQLDDLDICLTCSEEDVTLPQPEKEGFNFVGWYSDESLENEVIVDGLNTEVQLSQFKLSVDTLSNGCSSDVANTTLYARYENYECKTPDISFLDINFVTGDDTELLEDVKKCLDCDEDYYDLPIMKKEGQMFVGWFVDADYSKLVSKRINLVNAIKYMNVTRDFENGCSTDTISTILYAKWISLDDIENVRVVYLANGKIVDDKIYNRNAEQLDLPTLKEKGLKLDGWYVDSNYQIEFNNIDDLLENSYGVDFRSGQLFLYVYGKVSEVKGIDFTKAVLIIVILIVIAGILYIIINEKKNGKKKQSKQVGNKVTWHT